MQELSVCGWSQFCLLSLLILLGCYVQYSAPWTMADVPMSNSSRGMAEKASITVQVVISFSIFAISLD